MFGIKSNRDKVANGFWLLMSDPKELLNLFEFKKKIKMGVAHNGRLFAQLALDQLIWHDVIAAGRINIP